ncbi:MAG TPA: hypothetical protein VEJ63_08210 [Planctomycetota bacterium]|nr:hypothetical protein [Planctomycetota bacterium]
MQRCALLLLFIVFSCCAEDDIANLKQIIAARAKAAPFEAQIALGKVRVKAASDSEITLDAGAVQMNVPWARMSKLDLVRISREAAQQDTPRLTVAEYAVRNGAGEEVLEVLNVLARSSSAEAARARELRAEVLESIAAKKAAAAETARAKTMPPLPPLPPIVENIVKNHEGRKLPALPMIDAPVMYNTTKADEITSALQIFPQNNPWNEDISKLPVHKDSDKIIASMGGPSTRIGVNRDMSFVIVPPQQAKVPVRIVSYPRESDPGPYPVPDAAPIEGFPANANGMSLERYYETAIGDRHMIVLDPVNMKTYEFCNVHKREGRYEADVAACFDLTSNKTRPRNWTSADAAGLSIFPAIVRYDECERGMVEHALRVTARATCRGYIWPATHHSSKNTDPSLPMMGQRLRLKADVKIDHLPKHAKAVALALKKYGMIVADHGRDFYISTSADERLRGLEALKKLTGGDFEVVETTPETGGPRAPGAMPAQPAK